MASPPSEYSTPSGNPVLKRDAEIWSVAREGETYAAARGVPFYDILRDMRVGLEDQLTYFEDWVHPTSLQSRRVIANHWSTWLQGGAVRTINRADVLTRAKGTTIPDMAQMRYSLMDGGYVPESERMADYSTLLTEPFDTDLTGWTTGGTAPVIAAAPFGGNALRVRSAAGAQSYVQRSLAFLAGNSVEFDLMLPAVSGLVTQSGVVNIALVQDAVLYIGLQIVFTPTGARLRAVNRGQSADPASQIVGAEANMPLLAGVVHKVKLEGVRESGASAGNGRLLISMDGRLVTPPLINADASRGDAALGVKQCNFRCHATKTAGG